MQELSQNITQESAQISAQITMKSNHGFLIQASGKTRQGELVALSNSQDAASCSGHCKAGSCIAG